MSDSYYVIQFRMKLNDDDLWHRDIAGNIARFYDYRNAVTVFYAFAKKYPKAKLIRIDSDGSETWIMEAKNYE